MKLPPWELTIPILLAALYWWLTVSAAENWTTHGDELGQITAGYSYQKYGDFRLLPEAGWLPMRWATLPLAFSQPRFPSRDDYWWKIYDYNQLGREFFFESNNDPADLLRETRSMIAILGAALGLVVYFWSRSIFGRIGAAISMILYVLFPQALGLGGYVLSDLSVGLFFTAATWAIWHSLHKISPWSILAVALSVAGLFLSKISSALILPVALLLLLIRLVAGKPLTVHLGKKLQVQSWKRQLPRLLGAAAVQAVLVWFLIWSAYGFRFYALQEADGTNEEINPALWSFVAQDPHPVMSAIEIMREAQLLPEPFLYGAARMWYLRHTTSAMARISYLNGNYSLSGFVFFFPISLLYKTPLGTFLVLALAGVALAAIWRRRRSVPGSPGAETGVFYQLTPLLVFSVVYWMSVINAPVGNAFRYLFPVYPPLFVLAGAAGWWFQTKNRLAQGAVCLGLLATAVASFSIRPNYVAFFNCLAGGPANGYKHLLDQDDGRALPALKKWLDAHYSPNEPLYLSYLGHSSPRYYGIGGYRLPTAMTLEPVEPASKVLTGGLYCISQQNLVCNHLPIIGKWSVPYENLYQQLLTDPTRIKAVGVPTTGDAEEGNNPNETLFQTLQFSRLCAYLRHREPDAQVAYSIMVYKLTDADVHEALYGPPAELLPKVDVSGYPELLH